MYLQKAVSAAFYYFRFKLEYLCRVKLFTWVKKFPPNFLWGISTSAYQIEGGNDKSDWWQWAELGKVSEKSGRACDYWNKWKEDHTVLSELGVGAFRLSLEWSRIEPEEGKFSEEALNHYREILEDIRKRNIKTVVTLWHWTSPIWFQEKYGLHKKTSVTIITRYADKVIDELGNLIDMLVTFNEPMVPLGMGFLSGIFPPGAKNPWKFWKALNHIALAHKEIYELAHEEKDIPVGITYLYNFYHVEGESRWIEKIADKISRYYRTRLLGNKLKGYEDYVGVDYYRLGKIVYDRKNSEHLGFRIEEDKDNAMGWVVYPKGIYAVLKDLSRWKKLPIYILENGVPTNPGLSDQDRIRFIQDHLGFVAKAIEEGVDVRGYFHWSFMDNYEWDSGFRPRFGLIEIDYATLERKKRASFEYYKAIIKGNSVE